MTDLSVTATDPGPAGAVRCGPVGGTRWVPAGRPHLHHLHLPHLHLTDRAAALGQLLEAAP